MGKYCMDEMAEVSGVITHCTQTLVWLDDGDRVVPRIPKNIIRNVTDNKCRDVDLCDIEIGVLYNLNLPYDFAYQKELI